MYYTNNWRILTPIKGLRTYLPEQVRFIPGNPIKHSSSLDKHIDRIWKQEIEIAKRSGVALINGPLLRFDGLQEDNNNLTIKVGQTNYREYKATCIQRNKVKFERSQNRLMSKEESARTFASETLPVTLDGYVIFLERSNIVDQFKGQLSIPSGGRWDGNPLDTYQVMLRSSEELFERCRKIVKKEFSYITQLKKEDQKLLGLGKIMEYDDYDLLFIVNLNIDSDDILKNKDRFVSKGSKYQDLTLVKFEESKLTDFLNKNMERISPIIHPGIIMAGAYKFGEEWPLSIKKVKKRN